MDLPRFEQSHPDREMVSALSPEKTLKNFAKYVRDIRPRYEEVVRLIAEREAQILDILHYIELHPNLSASKGYAVYKALAQARRERREYKIERELLEPLYQYLVKQAPNLCDCLSAVQGRCKTAREAVENRSYKCRTDALKEWL